MLVTRPNKEQVPRKANETQVVYNLYLCKNVMQYMLKKIDFPSFTFRQCFFRRTFCGGKEAIYRFAMRTTEPYALVIYQ